jgi:hypothetical protein
LPRHTFVGSLVRPLPMPVRWNTLYLRQPRLKILSKTDEFVALDYIGVGVLRYIPGGAPLDLLRVAGAGDRVIGYAGGAVDFGVGVVHAEDDPGGVGDEQGGVGRAAQLGACCALFDGWGG